MRKGGNHGHLSRGIRDAIRQSFNVSQAVFARLINVSLNTVESWDQGARRPREATLKLLTIAHTHPEILLPRSLEGRDDGCNNDKNIYTIDSSLSVYA